MTWNHDLCRAVLGVYAHALLAFQPPPRAAARHPRRPIRLCDGQPAVRRGLNLNVHFHTLVFDGVFTGAEGEPLRFQPTPPPTDEEIGGEADITPADPVADESLALAGISRASIQGPVALGRRAGARAWRVGEEPDAPWLSSVPRHAHREGFDLHANVAVPAGDRARLEQLCRYLLRPAVSQDRLQLLGDGRVLLTLKTAWADGTRHLLFEPLEPLKKLAAMTPRPRINLVLYHGVLAPHARWRGRVAAYGGLPAATSLPARLSDSSGEDAIAEPTHRHWSWAKLMRRAFEIDVPA